MKSSILSWGLIVFHPAGTAAMGKVLDTECRVKGGENLRIQFESGRCYFAVADCSVLSRLVEYPSRLVVICILTIYVFL